MATFNAGYATNRQDRFTRSGALRSLRLARLSRCRRFRPSPCPTHYGGRWATMLSADVCLITPEVAAKRAARVMGGSGGDSSAFASALRPAPVATTAPLGFDGDSRPFGLALSSTPIGTRTAREMKGVRSCINTVIAKRFPAARQSLGGWRFLKPPFSSAGCALPGAAASAPRADQLTATRRWPHPPLHRHKGIRVRSRTAAPPQRN